VTGRGETRDMKKEGREEGMPWRGGTGEIQVEGDTK